MGMALNHLQRQAIQQDPEWAGGHYLPQRPPRRGLALARQIAMLSYKSAPLFDERFGRQSQPQRGRPAGTGRPGRGIDGGRFDIAGYLDHQGQRFVDRFDANAYLAILRTMDTWDPLHGHGSPEAAFGRIQGAAEFCGHQFGLAVSAGERARLCFDHSFAGVQADYREMASDHGHDAFLAEQAELVRLLHSTQNLHFESSDSAGTGNSFPESGV